MMSQQVEGTGDDGCTFDGAAVTPGFVHATALSLSNTVAIFVCEIKHTYTSATQTHIK